MLYLRQRKAIANSCGVPPSATSIKAAGNEQHPAPTSTNSRLSSANASSQDGCAAGWRARNPRERRLLFL